MGAHGHRLVSLLLLRKTLMEVLTMIVLKRNRDNGRILPRSCSRCVHKNGIVKHSAGRSSNEEPSYLAACYGVYKLRLWGSNLYHPRWRLSGNVQHLLCLHGAAGFDRNVLLDRYIETPDCR